MKRTLLAPALLAAIATSALAAPEALPDPIKLYQGTYWGTSYYPTNSGGEPMCLTSGSWTFASGATSRAMLKWQTSLGLFMHITKSNWRLPENVKVPLKITFDGVERDGIGTTLKGATGSSMIEIHVEGTGNYFLQDFSAANTMVITFLSGNEPPWTARMQGSREAVDWLGKCISYIKDNGGGATSPVPRGSAAPSPRDTSPIPPLSKPVPTTRERDNGQI